MYMYMLRKKSRKGVSRRLADELGWGHIEVYPDGRSFGIDPVEPLHERIMLNWGVSGGRWRGVLPQISGSCVVNPDNGMNKYNWLELVEPLGVPLPGFKHQLDEQDDLDLWIAKPYHSAGGRDIFRAKDLPVSRKHYYQKFIDRKYELRVSFFSWMPDNEWLVWKKVMKNPELVDQIPWNHRQGGVFVTINQPNKGVFKRAKYWCHLIAGKSGYAFGAVDFIVDKDGKEFFIELNKSPGWSTEINRKKYYGAFDRFDQLPFETKLTYTHIV